MQQPSHLLDSGIRIHTHKALETTMGMVAPPSALANRRADADGVLDGIVPGHGGDVYWVKHPGDKRALYCFTEFELAQNDTKNKSA